MSRDDRNNGYGFLDSFGDEPDGTNRQYKDRQYKDRLFKAIAELRDGTVKEYLRAHQSEVIDMILTEYDEKATMQAERYVGERIGLEKGIKIGEERGLEKGLQMGQQQALRHIIESVARGDIPVSGATAVAVAFGVKDEADFRRRAAEQGITLPE